jgi:hypothetical protein
LSRILMNRIFSDSGNMRIISGLWVATNARMSLALVSDVEPPRKFWPSNVFQSGSEVSKLKGKDRSRAPHSLMGRISLHPPRASQVWLRISTGSNTSSTKNNASRPTFLTECPPIGVGP